MCQIWSKQLFAFAVLPHWPFIAPLQLAYIRKDLQTVCFMYISPTMSSCEGFQGHLRCWEHFQTRKKPNMPGHSISVMVIIFSIIYLYKKQIIKATFRFNSPHRVLNKPHVLAASCPAHKHVCMLGQTRMWRSHRSIVLFPGHFVFWLLSISVKYLKIYIWVLLLCMGADKASVLACVLFAGIFNLAWLWRACTAREWWRRDLAVVSHNHPI